MSQLGSILLLWEARVGSRGALSLWVCCALWTLPSWLQCLLAPCWLCVPGKIT